LRRARAFGLFILVWARLFENRVIRADRSAPYELDLFAEAGKIHQRLAGFGEVACIRVDSADIVVLQRGKKQVSEK
jgi:hypothetical protein